MDDRGAIITKVCRPKITGSYYRKRLFDILDHYCELPLVWIMGPAGSGKTTLASTYIDFLNLPCIWYQIDPGDNDPATFFHYLGQAVLKDQPKVLAQLPPFTPEYIFGAEVFSRRFFEQIGRILKPPLIFVFDNYQFLASDSILHNLINAGLTHLSSGFRAIILSRKAPPAVFARLKAHCQMGTLVWKDLRLGLDETSAIIDLKATSHVSRQIKNEIHKKCEGWAAGLSLIWQYITTMQTNYHLPDNTPEEIFDYFAQEVFNSVDSESKAFLIKSSFLPDINLVQAIALTGNEKAKDILLNLQSRNFFINQPDENGFTFRYHPLFREFLQAKAMVWFGSEELLMVRKTAGNLLEWSGSIEEAISLYLSCDDYESAIRIILQSASLLISQGRNNLLLGWLNCLPELLIEESHWLLYWTGIARIPFEPLTSYKIFEDSFQISARRKDFPCKLLSFAGILDSVFYGGEDFSVFDKWLDKLDILEAEIRTCPDVDLQLRVAGSVVNALIMRRPQHPKIEFWMGYFLNQKTSPQNLPVHVSVLCQISWYFSFYKADFLNGQMIIEKIHHLTKEKLVSPVQILNKYVIEAMLHGIVGNNKKCSRIVSEALSLSETSGVRLFNFMLIGHEISNSLNKGDLITARKLLKKLDHWEGHLRLWDKSFYHFLKARTALISKNVNEALIHAEMTQKYEDMVGSPMGIILIRIILAQIIHAQGKAEEAKDILEQVLKLSEQYEIRSGTFFVLFLKAQFALAEKNETLTAKWLQKVAEPAKNTGFVNTYVDRPEATADLCVYAIENEIEPEYFRYVVHVRHLVPSNPPIHLDTWPWPLKIYTLGQFRIDKVEQTLGFVGKVQHMPLRLLKLIITIGGIGIPEGQISDVLWPDSDGYSAHRAFSTALYRLRQLLEIPDLFKVAGGKISINKRMCWVDSWAFDKLTGEMLTSEDSINTIIGCEKGRHRLEKAILYYQGDFLKLEDWCGRIIFERERLRGLFIKLIESLGNFLEETKKWHDAIQFYQRGLAVDECVENFYQHLMVCYSNIGQKAEALAVFERCRKILISTYGIEPGNRIKEIRSMIKNRF